MANGSIQLPPDSTGKKLQTFDNAVGAEPSVHAEGMVIVDAAGAPIAVASETSLVALSAKITNPLPVSLSTLLNPHPVTGTVTANAGTNLNTSLLALEAGGNLAVLVAKDFATQTTLALMKAKTDNLDVLLSTRALEAGGNLAALVAKDFATQTTLASILAQLDNKTSTLATGAILNPHPVSLASIPNPSNLDIAISLLSRETTLGTVHGHVDSIDGKVTACNTGAIGGSLTQSTKHDAKVYLTIQGGSAADGATVISNVANKVIKIHQFTIQSSVDGATTVYFYEETSGTQISETMNLNAREGIVNPFVPAPACLCQTTVQNKKVLLKNAAAKQLYWRIVYSADDAS